MTKTVLCAVGTRPEAIKMAPVIRALQADPDFNCRVLATAQHRQMLDQMLKIYDIQPDIDLDIMQPNQGLTALTGRLLLRLDDVTASEKPDAILAQGDTTTVLATALASFYADIPFGHVEAGLRTGNIRNPFPEEMNRVVASHLTRWHFAPTQMAADRLLAEGYDPAQVVMTGNTVIDSLHYVAAMKPTLGLPLDPNKRLLLVTLHRRENFGEPLARICTALANIVREHPDTQLLLPVHHNPNVREVVNARFAGLDRVHLCDPLDYTAFVAAMQQAHLILSDSGGVQEEAPALGKPVLVLRETTERPEAVDAGITRLVGTQTADIEAAAHELLTDPQAYAAMARHESPYGDGKASGRIVETLRKGLIDVS
ncbi:UDP-N-acetylglucosamine 2-epimerase [Aliiroseovarius sp. xm-m-379]|uniref:non-hydrolyzing UDP-N-acetylglucosamine 2-epimerase n=1 Tax=unclassified Aliiroseovarius TaxID=2623558 RepID=UPI00156914CB|nr:MULTISPECIES: UDP-N-acetylglucosamine 2-epimerase (non-hydrolyzing) [unclassified Aliiroseovarius]NRP26403.1 UDP-N-acetylglucosamine 2-epimerase [Aliiroseovarius sp. xm-m-379]NRP35202.1 UDP-N-acetylglucosamine 2-epimerase [Aliiroseovarius sp. xm-a-104]NRP50036.1 UDP-N-acetylglucosamine 2-epimerase [Aliiroseovarius sp. xm-m-354]NRQ04790.1 UDP-N-acetylglucosamine 2-epimerase [Aliiroseovarius sp. xm-m-309]NRQ07994.1 UDP-N-acetylglucosamine 2-epimerase [Aliiroseovarius sp. xm-v-201]